MPRIMHLQTEIYPNLESISELFKMYMKSRDSFILTSRDNWVSCIQTLGCLRLYGDSRVSRAQPRINTYEIFLHYDWLLFFSRHIRLAETHSYLQLPYQITDRLLAAGNTILICFMKQQKILIWNMSTYFSSSCKVIFVTGFTLSRISPCSQSQSYVLFYYQIYSSFAVFYFRMTSLNINLELLEKCQTIEECIRCNGKVLKKLKISTEKHELPVVESVEAYKDRDWQKIRCTW